MKSYLITDPHYYSSSSDIFKSKLQKALKDFRVDYALFRDKKSLNRVELAEVFINCLKNSNTKSLIHTDINLAKKLNAFGVHLDSNSFDKISNVKELGLFCIISTHTISEAKLAYEMGADAITFSPIFETPNKGKPQGLEKLKQIVDTIPIKLFALGGIIGIHEIELLNGVNPYGFASIRYFIKE